MSESPEPPEPPALKLFLDRSVQGRRFVQAIKLLVEDVETINDRYGVKPAGGDMDKVALNCVDIDGYQPAGGVR
jgi:hypothetical protein